MRKIGYMAIILFFSLFIGPAAYAGSNVSGNSAASSDTMQSPGFNMSGSNQQVGVVNINTASADQLKMLPGIDDNLARNIVAYRDSNGPFRSTDDLLNVSGMTKDKYNKISQNLVLEGDTTYQPGEGK